MESKEIMISKEEQQLFSKAQSGDDRAFAILYEKYSVLSRYLGLRLLYMRNRLVPGYMYEDAVRDALMRSILSYDPTRGTRFSTLLSKAIKMEYLKVGSNRKHLDISFYGNNEHEEENSFNPYEDMAILEDAREESCEASLLLLEKLLPFLPKDNVTDLMTMIDYDLNMGDIAHMKGVSPQRIGQKMRNMQKGVRNFFYNINLVYNFVVLQRNSIDSASELFKISKANCNDLLCAYEYFYKDGPAPTQFLSFVFGKGAYANKAYFRKISAHTTEALCEEDETSI